MYGSRSAVVSPSASESRPVDPAPVEAPGEKAWSWPLVAFLIAVVAVLAFGLLARWPTPELGGAVAMLEDGDLDGDERKRMLERVLRLSSDALQASPQAPAAGAVDVRWTGALSAMALGDGAAFRRWEARLSGSGAGGSAGSGAEVDRALPRGLDLGEPMLGNVRRALEAELAGDADAARTRWRQVAAQARLTGHALAAEVAAERLGGG